MTKIDPDQDYRRINNQSEDQEISKRLLIAGAIFWAIGLGVFAWYVYS